jgi:hypothetical protein
MTRIRLAMAFQLTLADGGLRAACPPGNDFASNRDRGTVADKGTEEHGGPLYQCWK